MKKKCKVCGKNIPKARLEALPNTETCVEHSTVQAKKVYPIFDHKTAPEILIVDPEDTESVRQADRANRRGR